MSTDFKVRHREPITMWRYVWHHLNHGVSSGCSCRVEPTCSWRTAREKHLPTAAATTVEPGQLCRQTGRRRRARTTGSVQQKIKSFIGLVALSLKTLKVSPKGEHFFFHWAYISVNCFDVQWHHSGSGESSYPVCQLCGQRTVPWELQVHLRKLCHLTHEHRQKHHTPAGEFGQNLEKKKRIHKELDLTKLCYPGNVCWCCARL